MYSSFPNGFRDGVSIQGFPQIFPFATSAGPANQTTSGVLWVDSAYGADGNDGTYYAPLATISRACTVAKANDIIMVKPGHTETITAAGGVTLSAAGVQVIGLGFQQRRPTVSLTTATTATFLVTGANSVVRNLRFKNGINSLATVLDVQAVGVTVDTCEFLDGAATTGLSDIDLAAVSTTANAADQLRVINCRFFHPTAGNMNHAIGVNLVEDSVEIVGNFIYGNFALSGIHNVTGKVATNLRIANNKVQNLTAGKQAMNLISACTGSCEDNTFRAGDATVADAVYGSLTVGNGNYDRYGLADAGQYIVKKVTVTSSSIPQSGGTDLTIATATGGDMALDNIQLATDSTGLAGGTNFQLVSNNTKGLTTSPFMAETVANLGANKSIDMNDASVAKKRIKIESTKAIKANSTVGACTGAGTIDINIIAVRGANGAFLL